jgi:hypothetical protein
LIHNLAKALFGELPILPRKCEVCQPEFELCQEIVRRQETFELMALRPIPIQNLDSGGPLRSEALKRLRLLFDVDFYRNEVLVDEGINARIGIYLGIQPGTGTSHGGGVEIQQ